MISLEEFYEHFRQSVISDAESRGLMRPQAFFETVCEDLVSIGDLTNNYSYSQFSKRGIEIHGYDYDEERRVLTLLNYQYFQNDFIETLTGAQIDTKLTRTKNFFSESTRQDGNALWKKIEESSEAYSASYLLYDYCLREKVDKVRVLLLTDGKVTSRLKEIPAERINDFDFEFRIIDIEYLQKIYLSQNELSDFEIDVNLPALKIDSGSGYYQSYLTVINGLDIVDIYDKHGQKLFEQNVRTFLQFRGDVNKGLRNTIENRPDMFFAYNNGITATASDVELDSDGRITKIKNFQIVNGAQTTSAIYASNINNGHNVSDVNVQMKLSVVDDGKNLSEFVSKVAEYANTQNKVNKSDFFSNSSFHREMKDYSNRVFAPAVGGVQVRTHWYYERVRGEYLNEMTYMESKEKQRFINENPKNQLIDKRFLAKAENSWNQKPYIVSKGAGYFGRTMPPISV
ncbi:abortive phage infection protein, partial [Myroides pelagicus]|nr:abortive phage infection protein [Myroides pelagicus]